MPRGSVILSRCSGKLKIVQGTISQTRDVIGLNMIRFVLQEDYEQVEINLQKAKAEGKGVAQSLAFSAPKHTMARFLPSPPSRPSQRSSISFSTNFERGPCSINQSFR